jgi:hypothetical protein
MLARPEFSEQNSGKNTGPKRAGSESKSGFVRGLKPPRAHGRNAYLVRSRIFFCPGASNEFPGAVWLVRSSNIC